MHRHRKIVGIHYIVLRVYARTYIIFNNGIDGGEKKNNVNPFWESINYSPVSIRSKSVKWPAGIESQLTKLRVIIYYWRVWRTPSVSMGIE